jgi:hypothetical protein
MGRGRSRWLLGPLAAGLLGLSGCFMDDFSWRNFSWEQFRDPPEPLKVVRDSKDGNLRARALRCIKEPLANGGTQQDQDVVVAVLNYSAGNDTQALCRMAAIDTLRKFQDPRAVEGLKEAYYRAGSFNAEVATVLRCQALQGLGETGNPAAVETLVRVLREPPVEGPDVDRQLKMDERIAAARALGHFRQAEATSALVEVLRKEQDVALRGRAQESLVAVTGKELPPDAQAWGDFLQNASSKDAVVHEPSLADRAIKLMGFK